MKAIVLSALLALSILGEIATVARAGPSEAFGTRTAWEQGWSPN